MCIRQISSGNVSHSFGFGSVANSAAEFMLTALRTATVVIGIISLLHGITTGNPVSFFIAGICLLTSIALFPTDGPVVIAQAPRAPWYHSYVPSFPFYSPSYVPAHSYAPPVQTYHHVSHISTPAALPSSYPTQSWFGNFSAALPSSSFSNPFASPSYDMAARGSLRTRSYDYQAALPSFQSSFAPSFGGGSYSSFAAPADLAQRGTLRSRG